MPLRAVGYCRCSTDKQDESISIQQAEISKYAEKHGYEIARWYVDDGIDGHDESRPNFCQMLSDADSGQWQFILVRNQSRFGRFRAATMARYLDELDRSGVQLVTTNKGPIDIDNLGDFIVSNVEAEDPQKVGIAQWIFESYVDGNGFSAIAAALNRRGITSSRGGEWHQGTIRAMLKNPIYCGDCAHNAANADELHEIVVREVISVLRSPKNVEAIRRSMERQSRAEAPDNSAEVANLRKRLGRVSQELDAQITRLGRVPEELVDDVIKKSTELKAEQSRLERQLEAAKVVMVEESQQWPADDVVALLDQVAGNLEQCPADKLQAALQELVEKIELDFTPQKYGKMPSSHSRAECST